MVSRSLDGSHGRVLPQTWDLDSLPPDMGPGYPPPDMGSGYPNSPDMGPGYPTHGQGTWLP